MILYLDTSALVKLYIHEKDSENVANWLNGAEMVVTAIITRVEVAAAIGRAGRMKILSPAETREAILQAREEWESINRLPITENTVIRGDAMAYEYNLRGYDAIHLACALIWQETIGMPVTLASFDNQLIEAAKIVSIAYLPS